VASWDRIKDIRLLVDDPPRFVSLVAVANAAALPATPAQQTCYYLQDTKRYVATDKESGAVAADYVAQLLRVSDERISDLVDAVGADAARCRVLRLLATKLGAEMQLSRTSMGGDESAYTSLRDMYAYYKGLADECDAEIAADASNSTGRAGRMTSPEIAGGLT